MNRPPARVIRADHATTSLGEERAAGLSAYWRRVREAEEAAAAASRPAGPTATPSPGKRRTPAPESKRRTATTARRSGTSTSTGPTPPQRTSPAKPSTPTASSAPTRSAPAPAVPSPEDLPRGYMLLNPHEAAAVVRLIDAHPSTRREPHPHEYRDPPAHAATRRETY